MNNEEKIKKELNTIDCLLQDKKFAEEMAIELEAAHYKGIEEKAPPFLETGDSTTIDRSFKEDKIAMNMAGFYALECGLNYLCSNSDLTPLQWLEKIISHEIDEQTRSILNRFANATWKAGQPFGGLDRIQQYNFISFSSLPGDEIVKDRVQVLGTARKLRSLLQPTDKKDQLLQLRNLLQSKEFASEIAAFCEACYFKGENKPVPAFLTKDEEIAIIKKPLIEEKIATNVAGFYAVECATNFFVSTRQKPPSSILQSLIDDSISHDDKFLMARFANATWKAGQPFRGLDRITREIFTPFNFLNESDIKKDLVQLKAAAKKLLTVLHPE